MTHAPPPRGRPDPRKPEAQRARDPGTEPKRPTGSERPQTPGDPGSPGPKSPKRTRKPTAAPKKSARTPYDQAEAGSKPSLGAESV